MPHERFPLGLAYQVIDVLLFINCQQVLSLTPFERLASPLGHVSEVVLKSAATKHRLRAMPLSHGANPTRSFGCPCWSCRTGRSPARCSTTFDRPLTSARCDQPRARCEVRGDCTCDSSSPQTRRAQRSGHGVRCGGTRSRRSLRRLTPERSFSRRERQGRREGPCPRSQAEGPDSEGFRVIRSELSTCLLSTVDH